MSSSRDAEIREMIQSWTERGVSSFHGQSRTMDVESRIRSTMAHAFAVGKQMFDGLGGQEIGLVWNCDNHIIVIQGEIPDDAMVIRV